jgi:sugar/nucleoside kinase (ribokinase family)
VPYDVIAVGDVMLDGTLPAPVPGTRVHGGIELRAGGSAVNAARAAARLGARAAVVGRVGTDAAGKLVGNALVADAVEALLAFDPEVPTGTVIVVGGTSIVADPGASSRLAPEDLPTSLEASAVLVSGYTLLQERSEPAARAALERARATWVAVDVASARLVTAFGVERFLEATATVGVLLANEEEARALTGLEPETAALALARRYDVVCVKLGSAGALAASGEDVVRAPAQAIELTDTLGAGDAFAGGFLAALTREAGIGEALQVGCEAAAELLTARRAGRSAGRV